MQPNDFDVFDGKKFSELMKDIYDKSDNKSEKIGSIIDSLKSLIVTIEDAISILPMIKECLEVGVKNDKQLVDMAGVVQRLRGTKNAQEEGGTGGAVGFGLDEMEWKELRDNANKEISKLRDDDIEIKIELDELAPVAKEIIEEHDEIAIDEEHEKDDYSEFEEPEDLEDITANIDEELIEFDDLDFEDIEEFTKDDLDLEE